VTAGTSAARLRWYMVGTYVLASVAAVAVTFALVALGLEFSLRQWLLFLIIASFVIPLYVLPDVYMIVRHLRPITAVLQVVDRGGRPGTKEVSRAIVRALNLPFFSFVRVTLFHGPMASIGAALGLVIANRVADGDFAPWQIVGLALTIFLFASPAHAISEFFVIAKKVIPQVERLWVYCDRVEDDDQRRIISIRLRSKLLYLSIFVNSLPLLFFAGSIVFKVDRLLVSQGFAGRIEEMMPIVQWAVGVVLVCMLGTLAMSVFVASEVSRSASRLIEAMGSVERGQLDNDLQLTTTDEYAEVYRGFNLMLSSLREEVRILQLSHDLAGELNLDVLLSRLMKATTELLGADRSTLFIFDR
jgi:adenylate cyclase